MEINELIEGCKLNNQLCYTKIYNIYKPKLFRLISKYIKDEDTIEELIQQTFIKFYEKINHDYNYKSLDGWFSIISRNLSIDYLRKYNKNNHYELIECYHSSHNPFEDEDINNTIHYNSGLIKKYIDELTPAIKNVFIMHVIQDYKHKEIAEMLGINEGTSKSNLFKAKIKIKKMLNQKIETC
jgi:RNA polymerase sigma-70 factor (ECF subfamily)